MRSGDSVGVPDPVDPAAVSDAGEDRVAQEQATIQGIAEHLQRERPGKSISELWPEALSIFRTQFETRTLLPPEDPATSVE